MEGNTSSALVSAVEAVLFACGEPVSLARLQEACHVGKPEICQALETLEQQFGCGIITAETLKKGGSS